MGKIQVQGREYVAPKDAMTASEIKELAGVPANERLYRKDGTLLGDDDVVPTENADLGVVTSWERG